LIGNLPFLAKALMAVNRKLPRQRLKALTAVKIKEMIFLTKNEL
jgi:hypothetical protein